jgi:hypothetical protein
MQSRNKIIARYSTILTNRAGTPAQISLGGTSLVTMLPAPTIALDPISIPGITSAPAPIHTFRPIVIPLRVSSHGVFK